MAMLSLTNISKRYGDDTLAVAGIDLAIEAQQTLCLLGPSGCGKSTLLRLIAGLEQPDTGHILLNGRDLRDIPIHLRNFGLMFQDYALFPHRTVAENIEFGLRMAGRPRPWRRERVAEMLALVNLPNYGPRAAHELSGGEQQRVALARSLAPEPILLMLDEPLGSLDRTLRTSLMTELRSILQETGVTAIYVTHDQEEAMALGDSVAIMRAGRIEQIGSPTEVYTTPSTHFVARFLGLTNLLTVRPVNAQEPQGETDFGLVPLSQPLQQPMTLLIRPEAARLFSASHDRRDQPIGTEHPDGFYCQLIGEEESRRVVELVGTLSTATYHGSHYRIQLDLQRGEATQSFEFELPTFQRGRVVEPLTQIKLPPTGSRLVLSIQSELMTLIPTQGPI